VRASRELAVSWKSGGALGGLDILINNIGVFRKCLRRADEGVLTRPST